MLIKYLRPAPNGINLILFGANRERVYDFQPRGEDYVCDVQDEGDAATMLAITEGYEAYLTADEKAKIARLKAEDAIQEAVKAAELAEAEAKAKAEAEAQAKADAAEAAAKAEAEAKEKAATAFLDAYDRDALVAYAADAFPAVKLDAEKTDEEVRAQLRGLLTQG